MFKIYLLLMIFFLSSCSGFNEAGKILRNEKNYELSDQVRNILESSGLQIEDSEQGIQWKVTE